MEELEQPDFARLVQGCLQRGILAAGLCRIRLPSVLHHLKEQAAYGRWCMVRLESFGW